MQSRQISLPREEVEGYLNLFLFGIRTHFQRITSVLSMKDVKTEIITTTEQIGDLVDWLVSRHAPPVPHSPTLYLDLEGVNLSREGSLSILILLIDTGTPTGRVCLINVHTLGAQAFNTTGAKQKTLQNILEDEKIPKVFFDVRNDSDALFAHFGMALRGVEDVQLMESATRKTTKSRRLLNSLTKCVENNEFMNLGRKELAGWTLAKKKGEQLFSPEHGGSYSVFNQRPIPKDILSYCVGDVRYLPTLQDRFWARQTNRWQELVLQESKKRVTMSRESDYQPHGPQRAMAQWNKEQNTSLDQWNHMPSAHDYFDETFELHDESDDDESSNWYDDGPTSCRDIINDYDYHLYYSD